MSDFETAAHDRQFWDRVRATFQGAVDLPLGARADYLNAQCKDDPELRAEVESLLESHDLSGDFIERPAVLRATFAEGELVASRYRIVKLLGEGGMGEVYEADDRELHERVALKIIRPSIASDERILLRFKREIQLARKVTHPNVCRIFDVSHHLSSSAGSGRPDRRIAFVSMELLHGETLAQRLARDGRMKQLEALPIVRQMAAGLEAAHAAGIVHRDFKSANVMLTRDSGTSSMRAVITDFGLAQQSGSEPGSARTPLTEPGVLLGTPDYMAPEQVEHGRSVPATDVYALGIVMFEMLTGRLPFSGATPISVALSRLHQPPPSPRQLVPDIDPIWEAVILRCLARDPAERFQDANEIAAALDGKLAMPKTRRATARSRWQLLWLLVPLALVILPFVLHDRAKPGAEVIASTGTTTSAPAAAPRRSIAVLGFRNLSGKPESAWLSSAFSEMLTSELAAGEKLRPIAGEEVERAKSDLDLGDAETLAPATMERLRDQLGADLVVLGSYVALGQSSGGKVRLEIRLQDAAHGSSIATLAETGTEGELIDLASRAGKKLRAQLGIDTISQSQAAGLRAAIADDPEVVRYYSEGLEQLRKYDAIAARALFEKAIAKDPRYPLAHSALSQALSTLGYEHDAVAEAKKALDLSSQLARDERLSIEGRYYELARDWPKATEIYGSLVTFFPDDLSYRLRLAGVQWASAKAKDALTTLDAARKLPPPLGDDPRIDLAEADAARSATDYDRELTAARRAESKGTARGSKLIVARALSNEAFAFRDHAQLDQAIVTIRRSEELFTSAGDRGGAARALAHQGLYLQERGDLREARAALEKAMTMQRAIGNRSQEARSLNNLANVAFMEGKPIEAQKMYEQSLAIARELDKRDLVAAALGNIGAMEQIRGDLHGALVHYQQQIDVSRATDDHWGVLLADANIAEILRLSGHLDESAKRYDEALTLAREIKQKETESYLLAGIGELRLLRGDLAGARQQHEQALAMRRASGAKGSVAESLGYLAGVSIEEGKASQAEPSTREAVAEFQHEGAKESEAGAREVLARVLLAKGDAAGALAECHHAQELAHDSVNIAVHVAVDLTTARALAASGETSEATAQIANVLATVRKTELAGLLLDARLAQAEITKSPRAFASVRDDATKSGFALVAKKASRQAS